MGQLLKNVMYLGIGLCIGILGTNYYYEIPLAEKTSEIEILNIELNNYKEMTNYLEDEIKALNLYNSVTDNHLSLDSSNLYQFPCIGLNNLTEEQIKELTSPQDNGFTYFTLGDDELDFQSTLNIIKLSPIFKGLEEPYEYDSDKSFIQNLNDSIVSSVDKPVIYVYGAYNGQKVEVSLDTDSEIFCEYPKRDEDGVWKVRSYENGSLILNNDNKLSYNYLYWEAKCDDIEFDFSKGYCIKGSESAEFLDKILAEIGLSREEANEFIVYWLPKLEANKYNLISFQTDVYTDEFKLNIEPKTSNILRVFMAFKGLESPVEIESQDIDKLNEGFERHGLHIVEWGGSEVKDELKE